MCNESFISEFTKVQTQQRQSLTISDFSVYRHMTISDTTSTLAHPSGHLFDPYDFPDTLFLFACLLFTICPWGIITFSMCMCSRPRCCHWTAYKGLRTGLLLPLSLLSKAVTISPAWPTRATITTTHTWVVLSLDGLQLAIRVLLTPAKSILTEFPWVTQEARWAFTTTTFVSF